MYSAAPEVVQYTVLSMWSPGAVKQAQDVVHFHFSARLNDLGQACVSTGWQVRDKGLSTSTRVVAETVVPLCSPTR